MRAQVYSAYDFLLTITVATSRTQAAPSSKFQFAKIHEDFAAAARAVLREYKHCGASSTYYPAAKRLATYLPTHAGEQIFVVKELMPAGTPRDVDGDWQLEITRLRYKGAVHLTTAAMIADESVAEGIERAIEFAVASLLKAQGVPYIFSPGDQELRPADATDVDIVCELAAATARVGADVPPPPQA